MTLRSVLATEESHWRLSNLTVFWLLLFHLFIQLFSIILQEPDLEKKEDQPRDNAVIGPMEEFHGLTTMLRSLLVRWITT